MKKSLANSYITPPSAKAPRWRTRGAALALGFGLWLTIVIAYAWPNWAMVAYRLIYDGGVLIVWLAAALGIGAALLPAFLPDRLPGGSALFRIVTAAALGLGTLSLLTLELGLAGALNSRSAIVMLIAGIAAGGVRLVGGWNGNKTANDRLPGPAAAIAGAPSSPSPGTPEEGRGEGLHAVAVKVKLRPQPNPLPAYRERGPDWTKSAGDWFGSPAGTSWLLLAVAPFAALMTVGAMLPPGLLWQGEPLGYDVVEYHLQVPREWFEAGRIFPLHHNVYSFFPFNVEMHYLLAMHLRGGSWAGMYLAQFMHVAFVVLAVLAVCGIAIEFDCHSERRRSLAPIFAAFALAGTPWLTQLGAIAYDEGGFLLFGILAIGWAMHALMHLRHRVRAFALAGLMAGFACGAKLTAVPEVMASVAFVSLAAVLLKRQRVASGVVAVALFGVAGVLAFSPWLLRTWRWTGNPVFPELLSLGHGDFGGVQVARWQHAHAAQAAQNSVGAHLIAVWTELLASWQFGFFLVPLAAAAIVLHRRSREVWFLSATAGLVLLFWLGFTHLQSRFLILLAPILALLIARLGRWALIPLSAQMIVAIVSLNAHFAPGPLRDALPALVGREDLKFATPAALDSVPSDADLLLVGDARAFLYQRPMWRLSYRTIFDADTSEGRGVIEAWTGARQPSATQWLLIDPSELKRFEKTYQPFPTLPPFITEHAEPFAVPRTALTGADPTSVRRGGQALRPGPSR